MRLKPIPSPPADVDAITEARAALPLVPASEMDCCAKLLDRLDIDEREEARRWLTLLRALDLAAKEEEGFSRTRGTVDRDDLAAAFRENVYGAREAVDALGDEPKDAEAVFAELEGIVPAWERDKHGGDWRAVWRARTADCLEWLVRLGVADRREGGYVRGNAVPGIGDEDG